MAFNYPWGNLQGLNLTWFINQFKKLREDWATAEAGIDGALDAEIQKAEDALSDVFDARDAAAASATAAASSASQAGTSATAAQNSATAAASSATLANTKATAAGLSEANAAQSASQAALSASNAGNSATQAGNSATAAAGSATAAAGSATQAGNSATAAAGSATAAATSETNAAASAQRAEDAAAAAQTGAMVKTLANVPIASIDDALEENIVKLSVDIEPVQASGTPSPENPLPITGWTGANVSKTGKNLFDKSKFDIIGFSLVTDESSTYYGYYRGKARALGYSSTTIFNVNNGGFIGKKTDGILHVSFDYTGVGSNGYLRFYYDDGTNSGSSYSFTTGSSGHFSEHSNENKNCICVNYITVGGENSYFSIKNLQIEFGTVESTYEEFGAVIPITFPSSIGTVYAGILDVPNGLLKVYPYYSSYNGETLTGHWISSMDPYTEGVSPTIGAQVVNDGGTPINHQITPVEIEMLQGYNSIWSDTGNINLLQYYADSKGYIDAQDALVKALIAKELDEMEADTALTANDFRIVNNTLYRITAPVASGATLTPGTNCEATTVAAVLKTLLT